MRWFHQLTAFVIFNRKHTTEITGKSLISNTENKFMQTTTWACFMFSHFISTQLKPLQTFPAVSSCPTGDLECALRCLESFGDKSSWVEKRALVHTGRRNFLVCGLPCTVHTEILYRPYGHLFLRLFSQSHLYMLSSWGTVLVTVQYVF